jgi:hypothetical protein
MSTPFNAVIDKALVVMRDYGLDKLYTEDEESFVAVMQNYMLKGVPLFIECEQDLSYDVDTQTFNSDLTDAEIGILADYTVISWYEANLNDVLEFKETLQDREFKRLATGQNLKPRQDYLRDLYTRVKHKTTNYLWYNNWESLPFFGGGA